MGENIQENTTLKIFWGSGRQLKLNSYMLGNRIYTKEVKGTNIENIFQGKKSYPCLKSSATPSRSVHRTQSLVRLRCPGWHLALRPCGRPDAALSGRRTGNIGGCADSLPVFVSRHLPQTGLDDPWIRVDKKIKYIFRDIYYAKYYGWEMTNRENLWV